MEEKFTICCGVDVGKWAHHIVAIIIAEVASGLPKLVKRIDEKTPERHSSSAIMSHDRELTADVTRSANRLRSLLLAVCPALEEAMARFPSPAKLASYAGLSPKVQLQSYY